MSQIDSAPQTFRAIDVIRKKRDGVELSQAEIEGLVNAYTEGEIPDYQVSAWLMAVVLKGMTSSGNRSADRRDAAFGRGAGSFFAAAPGKSTSIPPVASATRLLSCWLRWRPPLASRCR